MDPERRDEEARRNPPLDASKRFPKGGYEVRYVDPEGHTRRRTFGTQTDALLLQAKVRTDIAHGEYRDDRLARTPFREVIDAWYATTANRRLTTRAGYNSILKTYIRPRLGGYAVGKITPSVIREFIAGLPEELSGTRKRHIFMTLVPIFKLAIDDGMIKVSPTSATMVKAQWPERDDREMLFLSAAQVDALANAITPRYRTLIYFAAYSGMRSGELAALRIRDLDFDTRTVYVRESVSEVNGRPEFGPPKTKNGKRQFKMPTFVTELLKADLGDRIVNKPDLAFTAPSGGMMDMTNFYKRRFKPAVRRVLPEELHGLRLHDLRHTCASILAHNSESPKSVSIRLGHSSIGITLDRYTHLFPEAEGELVDRLDATITAAVGTPGAPDATVTAIR